MSAYRGHYLTKGVQASVNSDRVPEGVREQGYQAFETRRTDSELLPVVFDSDIDDPAHPAARTISFEAGDVRLDVRVSCGGHSSRLEGEAAPGPIVSAALRTATSTFPVPVRNGRLEVEVEASPVSIEVTISEDAGLHAFHSDWFTV